MELFIWSAQADFLPFAEEELVKAKQAYTRIKLLDNETVLGKAESFARLAEYFAAKPPVFVRHICPAQEVCPGQEGMPDALLSAAKEGFTPFAGAEFSVQTRVYAGAACKPFDINTPLSQALAPLGALNVRNPQVVISVHITGETAYLGVSAAAQNLSAYAGGRIRLAASPQQISRAEFKLEEALLTLPFAINPGERVLDLGAAPGGWSRIAALKGAAVSAVDPARLDNRLTGLSIRHYPMRSQEFLRMQTPMYHILLNDMRMKAEGSAHISCQMAPALLENARALITLKLTASPLREIKEALAVLQSCYDILAVRQLFHNRQEVTVLARKSALEK